MSRGRNRALHSAQGFQWLDLAGNAGLDDGPEPLDTEMSTMPQQKNRQWLLARRPQGPVGPEDFRRHEAEIPEPGEGEILVRNLYLSCDPTQRGWMARETYMPAVPLGEVMRAFAGSEVVASRDPSFAVGQRVQGLFGWQDYAVVKPSTDWPILPIPDGFSIPTAMSALGLTGLTAYFGLLDVGQAKQGETVVVSGAAGATGSVGRSPSFRAAAWWASPAVRRSAGT